MQKPDYPWYVIIGDLLGDLVEKIIDGFGECFRWWDW